MAEQQQQRGNRPPQRQGGGGQGGGGGKNRNQGGGGQGGNRNQGGGNRGGRGRNRRGKNFRNQGGGGQGERQKQQNRQPVEKDEPVVVRPLLRYGVIFYDTFAQAKADKENLAAKKTEFDQLNIVIKAEGDQQDAELAPFGKLFAGAAWHLIHTRRVDEGWYNEPR